MLFCVRRCYRSPGLQVTENPLFIHLVGRLTLMNIGFLEIDTGDNSRSRTGEKEDKFSFLSSLVNNGGFHGRGSSMRKECKIFELKM